MTVETATYIDDLNSAYPTATDGLKQGDDHVRLIKAVLKATFPNIAGAVAASDTEMSTGIPIGCILMWSGSIATIPTGYTLCNGLAVTRTDGGGSITPPDLTGKFVIHADADAAGTVNVSDTGGTAFGSLSTVATASGGAHTPTGTAAAGGDHDHGAATGSHTLTVSEMPLHGHAWNRIALEQSSAAGGYSGAGILTGKDTHATTDVSAGTDGNPSKTEGDQIAATGGSSGHTHTISSSGTHTHTLSMDAVAAHTHTVDVTNPYLGLAYIMRY